MKLLSLAAAVYLFSSLLVAQTTTSFHSSAEGASVLANVNGTAIQIEVDRGATAANLMTFTSTQNSDGSITTTAGSGSIPNDDFVSGGLEHMSLNVDTSKVPGFSSVICTVSSAFPNGTCEQGPRGVIQVNWVTNRISTTTFQEEQHVTGLTLKVDSHIDLSGSSANASGTYLGLSFPSADNASINMNRNTTINITK